MLTVCVATGRLEGAVEALHVILDLNKKDLDLPVPYPTPNLFSSVSLRYFYSLISFSIISLSVIHFIFLYYIHVCYHDIQKDICYHFYLTYKWPPVCPCTYRLCAWW